MSSPSTLSRPAESLSRWLMQRRNVDLPDPDGPTRHMTSPRFTVREMLLRTWLVPKLFDTRSASTMGTSVRDSMPLVLVSVITHLLVLHWLAVRHRLRPFGPADGRPRRGRTVSPGSTGRPSGSR